MSIKVIKKNPTKSQKSIKIEREISSSSGNTTKGILPNELKTYPPKITENKVTKTTDNTKGIRSLEQLLHEVYEDSKVRTNLMKNEILMLKSTSSKIENVRNKLMVLARNDTTLELTRNLLILNTKIGNVLAITNFVEDVLKQHPAFQTATVTKYFEDNTVSVDSALLSLESKNYDSLKWNSPELPQLTKSEASKCKSNSVFCFILYIWLSSADISLFNLTDRMRRVIWRFQEGINSDVDRVAQLVQTRDTSATSIVFDLLKEENENLKNERSIALVRANKAEESLVETNFILDQQNRKIAELSNILQELEVKFKDYRSRSIYEYESLRKRTRGRLLRELPLLEDGLHALKRETPLVNVMVDHAERAIEGLQKELIDLEK